MTSPNPNTHIGIVVFALKSDAMMEIILMSIVWKGGFGAQRKCAMLI